MNLLARWMLKPGKMQTNLIDIWRNIDITVLFITHDLGRPSTWQTVFWS